MLAGSYLLIKEERLKLILKKPVFNLLLFLLPNLSLVNLTNACFVKSMLIEIHSHFRNSICFKSRIPKKQFPIVEIL